MELDEKGFTIRSSTARQLMVSPYSVSAHLIYENAKPDPILPNSGIRIDTGPPLAALSDNAVRVEGTTIEYLPYTMKRKAPARWISDRQYG